MRYRVLFGLSAMLWACDDGGSSAPVVMDAAMIDASMVDAAIDGGVVDAMPAPDMAIDMQVDQGVPPQAIVETTDPTPYTVDNWVTTTIRDDDPVFVRFERGQFLAPAAGALAYTLGWQAAELDEEGRMADFGRGVAYLAAEITVDEPVRIVAQLDRVLELYVNGVRQPGDVYGSGGMRLPIVLQAGENEIGMRVYGARGQPRIQLWSTPDEVVLNTADLTAPHLRVGDDDVQYLGVPLVHLTGAPATQVVARVVEDDYWTGTERITPGIAPNAVSQIGFELRPKMPHAGERPAEGEPAPRVPVTVEVTSPDWATGYRQTIELELSFEGAYRRTFLSPTDGSIQFYGVQPPPDPIPGESLGLVVSLHGAGVGGLGQARAYSPKDWAWLIAPTNRRPFGFDWEEWGRLNGLNAMADAMNAFPIDDTRVHLTGHSMGGHGTWHLGVHDGGRFAVIGPSAGWQSFYTYGGAQRPNGPFARSRAHSDTLNYVSNLTDKPVYIIHGDADNNVPVSEGRTMRDAVAEVTDDLGYHEEMGAGHWWDGDASPGADCVDWPPLFELMQDRTVDPWTLDFDFVSPSPAYNPHRSYVTVASVLSDDADFSLSSARVENQVILATENVRSLILDGDRLMEAGIEEVLVDGTALPVVAGPIEHGPQTGKRPGVQGPFNQVFHRPFCFIYPDERLELAHFAGYLTSYWALIGNGHACTLPMSKVDDDLIAQRNLIHLGQRWNAPESVPFAIDERGIEAANGTRFEAAALLYVFDGGAGLHAVLGAARGYEFLLYRAVPFTSRSGFPDFLIWSTQGARTAGFFDADWQLP
jgi:dienelactone hydrolase